MGTTRTRIERLLAAQLDDCCDDDVERRLDALEALATDALDDDPVRQIFAVLGNETRYRLVRVLAAADGDLCVCELEPIVDVSESAVSHALSDLVDAGLVTRRKEGNWRFYDATPLAEALFDTAERRVTADE